MKSVRTFSSNQALVSKRREYIVRCSTKVFTKKGYHATNMRELAQACEMSAGALYHYFGSKEEILYLIIDTATVQQAQWIEKSAKKLDRKKPTDALIKLMSEFYKWHDVNQNLTLFGYQETSNLTEEARQGIFQSEGRILTAFENLLKRGVEQGEFSIADPKLVAHDIMMLGHAWALRRWLLRKHYTFEAYLTEQTDIILKLIKPVDVTVKTVEGISKK